MGIPAACNNPLPESLKEYREETHEHPGTILETARASPA